MPWPRSNEPDPIEAKRRLLAERQRALSEQRRLLSEQLRTGELPGGRAKPAEPPVWRSEDDPATMVDTEPTPARKRQLARHRRRDMVLFFVFIAVLFIILVVLWLAYLHTSAPAATA